MSYKLVFAYVLVLIWSVAGASTFDTMVSFEEVVKNVSQSLKDADAKKLSTFFDNNVSLSLGRDEGSFTKFQAELLLSDFFQTNKVSELKEVQRANNASTSFVVFSMKAGSKNYRVFVKFILASNKVFKISEIRIE